MFKRTDVNVGAGDQDIFYIVIMTDAIQANDQEFCLVDVSCADEGWKLNDEPSTVNTDLPFDPTTYEFLYDSQVTYHCGIARAFEKSSTETVLTQEFTCSWTDGWTPTKDHMYCVCKFCVYDGGDCC